MNDNTKNLYDKIVILHNFIKIHTNIKYDFDISLKLDSPGGKTTWTDTATYTYMDTTCMFKIEHTCINKDDGIKTTKKENITSRLIHGVVDMNNILTTKIDLCTINLLLC